MNSDFNNCVGLITIFTALATTVWPINHGMGFPDSLGWVPHNAVPETPNCPESLYHTSACVLSPGGAAHRAGGVELGEQKSFSSHLVQVGGCGGWVAIAG